MSISHYPTHYVWKAFSKALVHVHGERLLSTDAAGRLAMAVAEAEQTYAEQGRLQEPDRDANT